MVIESGTTAELLRRKGGKAADGNETGREREERERKRKTTLRCQNSPLLLWV